MTDQPTLAALLHDEWCIHFDPAEFSIPPEPTCEQRAARLSAAGVRVAGDAECQHCDVRHEWPCPTIPRCDEPGCEREATCGWPTTNGYRRTCGPHMEPKR